MQKLFLVMLLLLAACGPSEDERRATWQSKCVPAFSPAQCEVLFAIKEDVRDAKSAATSSAAASGVAIGMSAGRR